VVKAKKNTFQSNIDFDNAIRLPVITPETDKGRVRNRKAVIQAFVLVMFFKKELAFLLRKYREE
jgi:hypothetical protein